MKTLFTTIKTISFLLASFSFISCVQAQNANLDIAKVRKSFQCIPCGYDCDKVLYNKPGTCGQCHMQLVEKSTIIFKSIEPGDICTYISQHPSVILFDVRTKDEFNGKADPDFGRLKNAINIPVQELEHRIIEISNLKNAEILVYCSHSHRSSAASYILTQQGFTNVTNMEGGMSKLADKSCKN